MESGHVQRIDGALKYLAPWVGLKIRSMLDDGASDIAIVYRKEDPGLSTDVLGTGLPEFDPGAARPQQ